MKTTYFKARLRHWYGVETFIVVKDVSYINHRERLVKQYESVERHTKTWDGWKIDKDCLGTLMPFELIDIEPMPDDYQPTKF